MPCSVFIDEDTVADVLHPQGTKNLLCSILGLFLALSAMPVLIPVKYCIS